MTTHDTRSYWLEHPLPGFAPLDEDLHVDVAVVGGGVTGITAAYLLSREGARVALLERHRLAAADTGHTTAHLTYVTDARLGELVRHFGKQGATAAWKAGAAAIEEIATIVKATGTPCEFQRTDGYLHEACDSNAPDEAARLRRDAQLATELGFQAEFVDNVPVTNRPGVRFTNQGKFHPRKYLETLVSDIARTGGRVFENSNVEKIDEDRTLHASGQLIRCDYLVLATHNPIQGTKSAVSGTLFQTKLALYTSYVLAASLPKETLPEVLLWDTADPYNYLRVDRREECDLVIFGGKDVKTGQEVNAHQNFDALQRRLLKQFPNARVTHRWLGQVIETDDGLPFIGENAEQQFIATGFAGNGFTFGTLAGMMVRDRLLQRQNAWTDLFKVGRKPFHGGLWNYLSENVDYPYHLVRDRLRHTEGESLAEVGRGEGKIVSHHGNKIAAYRSESGQVTLLSPVCTHLKCLVRWNEADRTWDCPCHGSRFSPTGEVLGGPAESPLETFRKSNLD